ISGNQALGEHSSGGGISATLIDATYSTITNNQATGAGSLGGGVFSFQNSTFTGSILAGNEAATGSDDFAAPGDFGTRLFFSLLGDTTDINVIESDGALLDLDPLLGPLFNNGGPTLTHAPLVGSPVVNAGDPTLSDVPTTSQFGPLDGLTDQRGEGFPRVTDGGEAGVYRIDLGAVEFPGATAP
ncbi:unnamed protein product, partial [Ectocarpus sp. 4 AP-2014]